MYTADLNPASVKGCCRSSRVPSPLGSALRASTLVDDERVLPLDNDLLLEEGAWRHEREHLLLDKSAGWYGRDGAFQLEHCAGRHGGGRALALLLAPPRRRRRPLHRLPTLRRPSDAQRCLLGGGEVAQPVLVSATSSVSSSASACCSACSFVSGATAAAAVFAAACPSGERATQSAASSAVAKQPSITFLPPRLTRAS
eukprot:scaffold9104_cov56-Phaeocystis_antarctica.AAC.5